MPGSHKNNFGYNEVSEEIGYRMMYQSPRSKAPDHTPESGEGYYDVSKQLGYHQADGGQPVPPGVLNVCPKAGDVVVTSGQVRLSNDAKVRVVESDATTPPAETPML